MTGGRSGWAAGSGEGGRCTLWRWFCGPRESCLCRCVGVFGRSWWVFWMLDCWFNLLLLFLFVDSQEARKFVHQSGVRVVVAYGGARIKQQVCDLCLSLISVSCRLLMCPISVVSVSYRCYFNTVFWFYGETWRLIIIISCVRGYCWFSLGNYQPHPFFGSPEIWRISPFTAWA